LAAVVLDFPSDVNDAAPDFSAVARVVSDERANAHTTAAAVVTPRAIARSAW